MAGYSEIYSRIPDWVQEELDRRASRSYAKQPRSAWVRATSGFRLENEEGGGERRILMGGDISRERAITFGFSGLYEASDAVPPKRPVPGITSVDITESDMKAEATIEWKAWSLDQLEELLPFFMNPATTLFLEIGWSDMDPSVVVDPLASEKEIAPFYESFVNEGSDGGESNIRAYKKHPRFVKMGDGEGEGQYFIFPGKISNFSFEMNQQGGFDCKTELLALAESTYKLSIVNNKQRRYHTSDDKNSKPILEKIRDDLEFEEPKVSKPSSSSGSSVGGLRPGPSPNATQNQNQSTNQQPEANKETPIVRGGENYPSSFRLGPNQYYSWGQIEDIFNKAFEFAEGGDENAKNRAFHLNSADSQISYFRGEIFTNLPSDPPGAKEEIALKSEDLDVCVINAGQKRINQPPKFDKETNAYTGRELSNTNGRSGWLYHMFISTKVLKEAIDYTDKYWECLRKILEECSSACHGIWDFELVSEPESNTLQVVDKNHLYEEKVDDMVDNENHYTFQVYTKNSQIRDFSLSSNLADQFVNTFAAANLAGPEAQKPIVNARSDATGQFFNRFQGEDVVSQGIESVGDEPKEQSGEKDDENPERNQKDKDRSDKFFTIGWVPKVSELENLQEKREEDIADWDDAQFKNIFPSAWEILQTKRALNSDGSDHSPINANALIDVDVSLSMHGIAGIRRYQIFKVQHVPSFYKVNGVFVVESVRHRVQNNDWVTNVEGRFLVANMFQKNVEEDQ